MRRTRVSVLCVALSALALPLTGQESRNELELGTDVAKVGTNADVPLTLSTTDQVQGLQVAFEWDAAAGTGVDLILGAILSPANADTVTTRVGSNFMVLGVVMDSDGAGNEIIAPGNDILLATARIRCSSAVGTSAVTFVDSKYALVGDEPKLENVVVVGGLSIGGTEGLIKTNGSFECVEGFNRFYIDPGAGNTGGPGGLCGDAVVRMENLSPVEGYVVSLCHDSSALSLDSIAVGAAATAQAADFSAPEVFPTGGTLGVVIDLVAPFTNNTIPVGDANHIATYRYCCRSAPTAPVSTPLTFCDLVLGNPLKENVIVIGGLSINPELENSTFTCEPAVPAGEDCDDGVDNDGDGLIDLEDPDCQQMFGCGSRVQDAAGMPGPVEGPIGGAVEVCFFLKSPEDNAPGHPQKDHIQGFSMAVKFCCDLLSARPSFDISGTILEALGAEFVSIGVDNPGTDADPECELIIGVLIDALPPFDGATIPPLPNFQRMGCVTFDITDDESRCGECCTIDFEDGLKGPGQVPIKNLISRENESFGPFLMDCEVCITGEERFFRGDCNFSRMGMMMNVDIADAAAVVSFLFGQGSWHFNAPCLDACDCNDDGRVDLADAICILQFLFQNGRFPPAPGPGLTPEMVETPAGPDPTDDKLDCEAGGDC